MIVKKSPLLTIIREWLKKRDEMTMECDFATKHNFEFERQYIQGRIDILDDLLGDLRWMHSEWVSVEDRFPAEGEVVLVAEEETDYRGVDFRVKGHWNGTHRITHWMKIAEL